MLSYTLNDASGKRLCTNKVLAAEQWAEWHGRGYQRVSRDEHITEGELRRLLKDKGRIIIKPLSGLGGKGIRMVEIADDSDVANALDELNQLKRPHVVEEYLCQTGLLHDMNSSSLNTVRVITVRHPDGMIEALQCYLRVGHEGVIVDNVSSGGFEFQVDMHTGEIGPGADYFGNRHYVQPETGFQVTGAFVPRWEEVLDLCRRAHGIAPAGLEWVGWDVCVSEDGLSLIEANACPGWVAPRPGDNQWKVIRDVLDEWERAGSR